MGILICSYSDDLSLITCNTVSRSLSHFWKHRLTRVFNECPKRPRGPRPPTLLCTPQEMGTDKSFPHHKLVYNEGFNNFELPLIVENSVDMAQLLQGLSCKIGSTFLPTFEAVEVFILILNIFAIIHQSPCRYVVTTPKIGLFCGIQGKVKMGNITKCGQKHPLNHTKHSHRPGLEKSNLNGINETQYKGALL